MDLKKEEVDNHCLTILKSRRILNKIIILCEGELLPAEERESPALYSKLEKLPDANFYKACIPQNWNQRQPQFFNCGSRNSVIQTYFRLQELHKINNENSYLNPENLFAIIDSDMQQANFTNYQFSNSEESRNDLYSKIYITKTNIKNHRLFVTGLIHKEAYFLIPELEDIYKDFKVEIRYNSAKLQLSNIYQEMANDIVNDKDLDSANNYDIAKNRISFNSNINVTNKITVKDSWLNEFTKLDGMDKLELIYLLLSIRKAKAYWNNIESPEWTGNKDSLLDNIILEIGKFISKQDGLQFHIVHILKYLQTIS